MVFRPQLVKSRGAAAAEGATAKLAATDGGVVTAGFARHTFQQQTVLADKAEAQCTAAQDHHQAVVANPATLQQRQGIQTLPFPGHRTVRYIRVQSA